MLRPHPAYRYFVTLFALGALLAACSSSTPPTMSACDACPEGQYCCEEKATCEDIQYTCTADPGCQPGYVIDYGDGPFMDGDTCQSTAVECGCKKAPPLQPGYLGKHSDVAAQGTTLFGSTYDATYGDLVFFQAGLDALDKPTFEVVDGAPKTPIVKDPEGYRGGVLDYGEDAGSGTRITVSQTGQVSISYFAEESGGLRLASRQSDGSWQVFPIAKPTVDSKESVGRHHSQRLIDGRLSVVYLAEGVRQADGKMRSELRRAWSKNSAPKGVADWTTDLIDSAEMPCRKLCEREEACFVINSISSYCAVKTTDCTDKCAAGQACLNGVCTDTLDSTPQGLAAVRGQWPTQLMDGTALVVIYYDGSRGELKGARLESLGASDWQLKVITRKIGDLVGVYAAATIDGNGLHVAHQNASTHVLHYALVDPSTLGAKIEETIDDGVRPDGRHMVGADPAIAVDASGRVRVLYQDQQTVDLLSATRSGEKSWTPNDSADPHAGRKVLVGKKGYGFYSRVTTVNGRIYGVTGHIDPTSEAGGGVDLYALP